MEIAAMILVVSAALFLFYLQATCERILQRPFEQALPHPIVHANRLEFLCVRKALEQDDGPVDFSLFRVQLNCDYLALVYLLRNAANERHHLSRNERFLAAYFRALSGLPAMLRYAGIAERTVLLKMTQVLEYFANVLGERINRVSFGDLTPSTYLLSL
ncbi:MAG TPA: hypothetical protein VL523_04560 [Terriglobia bacterium]|nr:hypothetical protein [Terriglobia bacterium]